MTLQTLLVACVVLWVLDVPRMVFNLSFYTEQLLAVTLGLTLALAFTTETSRKNKPFDLAGAIASAVIVVYLVYSYRRDGGIDGPPSRGLPRRWPGPSRRGASRSRTGSTGSAWRPRSGSAPTSPSATRR